MSRFLIIACLVLPALSAAPADDVAISPPVIALPGQSKHLRLGLEVTHEAQSPAAVWGRFLERLVGWFDRDGDGMLDAAEAARVFPLPLPGRRYLKIAFPELDRNQDGKATTEELRAYCLAGGFEPIIVVVTPP